MAVNNAAIMQWKLKEKRSKENYEEKQHPPLFSKWCLFSLSFFHGRQSGYNFLLA